MKLHRLNRYRAGFTLAETIITAAIALGGIGAAMTLNGAHLKLVKSSRQSNAASLALQERVEQMRVVGWTNLMKETYIKNTFFLKAPESATILNNPKERIIISPYSKDSTAKNLIIDRDASGNRTTVSNGEGLNYEDNSIVRVELRLTWQSEDGRERTRATTTVISNGGISMSNLPAMGTVSGGTNTGGTTGSTSGGTSGGTTGDTSGSTSGGTTGDTSGGTTGGTSGGTTGDTSGGTTGGTSGGTTGDTSGGTTGGTSGGTTGGTSGGTTGGTSGGTTGNNGNGNGNGNANGNNGNGNGRGNVNGKPGQN